MDQELELLAPVVNELGDYTPYGAAMKEQFPDLSDKAIAHLHYFGGLVKDDAGYEANRLALRDKYGAMGLHQMEQASSLFKAQARTEEDLPPEIREVPVEEDPEEEYEGVFSAIASVPSAVISDTAKLLPGMGNDAVEGVVTGAADAVRTVDDLADVVTGLEIDMPVGADLKQADSDLGVFKFTPTEEEAAWLNENGMLRDGPIYNIGKNTIWRGETQGFTAGVETENRMSHGQFRAFKEAFPESTAAYEGILRSDALDGLASRMEKIDSISGGFVRGITEFVGLSALTGGGLGATQKAAVGISIIKPAVIDQIIYEENDGLAIQNVIEATGSTAPLFMSEVEDEPLMNRAKLAGESLIFGSLGETIVGGVKAIKGGNFDEAAKASDEARIKATKAQAEVVDEALLLADNIEDVDIGYQSPRDITKLGDAETDAKVLPEGQPELSGGATNRNTATAMRVQEAFRQQDLDARSAKAKMAAGSVLKDDIDPKVLDDMMYTTDFVKTIGIDDAEEGIAQTAAGIKKRYGKGRDNPFGRERTNFVDAHRHAKEIIKKIEADNGELPAALVVDLDSPDALADFEVRMAWLKGAEQKISVLGQYLRGDIEENILAKALGDIGEDWILELGESPKKLPMVAARVRELQADTAAVASKQKNEARKSGQILRASREFKTPEGRKKIEAILQAQAQRGEISPEALGKRLEALEQGTQKGKRKFGATKYDEGNTAFDDLLLYGQGNMLLSANVWSLNMVVEPLRLAYLGTVGGLARTFTEARKGNFKEAGRIIRKGTLMLESRKQIRRGLAGFARVWRTSQADLSNSASALGMETAELMKAKSLKDIWMDTNKINGVIPTMGIRAGARVLGSASYRIIAGISEFNTQVFYHHNVEMDALTGMYGKKWQELRKKNGFLSDAEMSAMLMSYRAKEELTNVGGLNYDNAYLTIAAESGFRNKEQGVIQGVERAVSANNAGMKAVKTLFPFLGMGLRTGREGIFMSIPGFSLLSRTTRAKMGFGIGDTYTDRFGNVRQVEVQTDPRVTEAMRAHYLVGPAAAMGTAIAVWMFNNGADEDDEKLFLPDPGDFRVKGVSAEFGETDQGIIIEAGGKEYNYNFSEMLTPFAAFALTTSLLDYISDPSRSTDEIGMAQDAAHMLSIASNATFGQQSVVRGLQSNLQLIDAQAGFGKNATKWALSKASAYAPINPLNRSIKTVVDEEGMRGSAKLDVWNNPGEALRENFYNMASIGEWNVGNKRRSVTGHLLPAFGRGISPLSNQAEAYKSKAYLEEMKLQYNVDLARDKIMVPGTEVDLSLVYLDSGQSVADAIAESLMTTTYAVRSEGDMATLDDALYEQFTDTNSELNKAHRAIKVAAEAGEDPFTQDNTGSDVLQRPEKVLQDLVRGYRESAYQDFMKSLKRKSPAEFKRIEELVLSRKGGAIFDTFTNDEKMEANAFVQKGERY